MINVDRRLLLSFDWLWFLALLALSAAGITAIWSTTDGTSLDSYFGKQLIYLCCAVAAFLVLLYFDYHSFADFMRFAVMFIVFAKHKLKKFLK